MEKLAPTQTSTSTTPRQQTADTTTTPSPPPNQNDSNTLETLCKTMNGKGLRTYIISQLPHNKPTLLQQLPIALKLAANPSKLVLTTIGDFYAKRGKSLDQDTQIISLREASALVLECFLLMGFDEIDEGVKEEAKQAAVIWRRRLVDERGIKKASVMDARGLLLLIGCFGIPEIFINEDVRDLIRVSKMREISSALRKSNVLMEKIPEIIEGMVKNKLEVEAVDAVYTFGVEEKCSPYTILSSFLEELKESLKKKKWKSHGAFAVVNEANKRELSTMRSVMECLEAHNIDPSKLIARFRISDRIISLEEKIAREDQRRKNVVPNWRFNKTRLSERIEDRQAKRTRILGLEQQRTVNYISSQRSPLLTGGTAGHTYGYSVPPPVFPGPVAGPIPDTVPGSYAGFRRRMPVEDKAGQIGGYNNQLYGWQGDASMHHERAISHNYGYRPSAPWQGSMGLPNALPVGRGNRNAASDLYQLANAVPGTAPLYQNSGSHAIGAVHSVNHHSSYLYPPGTYYPQGMQ
ncbi:protein FRIGIDA-like isoform X1 [Lycium ferocissimum]|uniref:protein FRIGIDA-like isoform X1 n=1 Tax=Lycium ferocissimum TaxID=112874 RepID=UPI002815BB63|nr:protein FRIGIDA-like isoform X1 [Lycium ferocissimum]